MTNHNAKNHTTDHPDVFGLVGDLPDDMVARLRGEPVVAWDIETSGLDWTVNRIATCQVFAPSVGAFVVQLTSATAPPNLALLLADERVPKVFHHAMFDLRFMYYQWGVEARSVLCTKIAAKILTPGAEASTLQALTQEWLGVHLDKSQRLSNWMRATLTSEQLGYAAADVAYLPALISILRARLTTAERWHLATSCFDFLPSRVKLDVIGSGDVFAYK